MTSICDAEHIIDECLESDWKKSLIKILCDEIYNHKLNLSQIISHLEPYLTSLNVDERYKAVDFFFNFIQTIKPETFGDYEINGLLEFFCNRLLDTFQIPFNISHSLWYLIENWKINDNTLCYLLDIILQSVVITEQNVEIRFDFYKVFYYILKNKKEDFINGYEIKIIFKIFECIEQERDPRCLMFLFNLYLIMCKKIDMSFFKQVSITAVDNYFPVVYNPPKSTEKYYITKAVFKEKVINCLVCTEFLYFKNINYIIEQFESASEEVKIDCYQALLTGSQNYSSPLFQNLKEQLWKIIKFDCLKKKLESEQKLSQLVINFFTSLTRIYLKFDDEDWFELVSKDIEVCMFNLDLDCYLPACYLYQILGINLPKKLSIVIKLIISNCTFILEFDKNQKSQLDSLKSLQNLFTNLCVNNLDLTFNDSQNLKNNFSNTILDRLKSIDQYSDFNSLFSHLSNFLIKILHKENINENYVFEILNTLDKIYSLDIIKYDYEFIKNLDFIINLVHLKNYKSCVESIVNLLKQINLKKFVSIDSLICSLFSKLNNEETLIISVKIIGSCQLNEQYFNQFVELIIEKLIEEKNFNLIKSISDELVILIKNQIENNIQIYSENVFNILFNLVIDSLASNIILINQDIIVNLIGEMCKIFNSKNNEKVQKLIFSFITSKNKSNDLIDIKKTLFIKVVYFIISNIEIINQNFEDCYLVFKKLFDLYIENLSSQEYLSKIIEILGAKISFLEKILNSFNFFEIYYKKEDSNSKNLLINVYKLILKASCVTNNELTYKIFKELLKILSNEYDLDICLKIISCIDYINKPSDDLTKEKYVNFNSFHSQRFYHFSQPILLEQYNQFDKENFMKNVKYFKQKSLIDLKLKNIENLKNYEIEALNLNQNQINPCSKIFFNENDINENSSSEKNFDKDNFFRLVELRKRIIAYCIFCQLFHLPDSLIKSELRKCYKLTSEFILNNNLIWMNNSLMENHIDFIEIIFKYKTKVFNNQILSLINFLILILNNEQFNLLLKTKCLNCLKIIATDYSEIEVIKLKKQVLICLKKFLDHKKRIIRYSTVKAINKWIIVGQPN